MLSVFIEFICISVTGINVSWKVDIFLCLTFPFPFSCILLLHRIFSLFRNFKLVIDVACMKYIEILLRWSIVMTDDQMQITFGVQSGETHGWSSNRFLFQQMIRDDNLFAGSLQRLDCKRRFWSKGLCPEQQQIKSTPPWSPDTGGGWWFGLGC